MRARRGVVHFFATLERGGAEMRTLELLRALGDEAREHRVVTLAREGGSLQTEFERIGVETVFLRAKSAAFPWRLRRVVGGAAVFHTHLGLVGGPVLALGRLLRVPVRVAHFRSDAADGETTAVRRLELWGFRWLVGRCATDIVGVSPSALTSGYRPDWTTDDRCRVLFSGLDLSPYERPGHDHLLEQLVGVPRGTPIVVHVGRDHPAKNRPRALAVFARVLEQRADAHLVFVGRDEVPSSEEQQDDARRRGIESHVHWLGERGDVPGLLRGAQLTLMTSTREGLPGVVLESVAAGTPVVASDLPGSVLFAEHFPGDVTLRGLQESDERWAQDVVAALAVPPDPVRRQAALERVQGSPFDQERCVDAFRELWDSSSRRGGPDRPRPAVVHLFSSLEAGGAELRTLELFQELRQLGSGFQQVVLQTGHRGPLTEEFTAAGARVVTQRFRSAAFWRHLVRELGRSETAAVHLHVKRGNAKSAVLLPLAAALRVPVRIAHFRSDGTRPARSRAEQARERGYLRLIDRFATDIVGVSPAALELGWRTDWHTDPRCRVVLSGVPLGPLGQIRRSGGLRAELGLVEGTPIVVHVGRGVALKNRRRAVEVLAATRVPGPDPAPHLVFIGRTEPEAAAADLDRAAELGIMDRVHVLGQRSDVAQLLADATVLLLTSTQEGLPGVLVEALAVGTPAVASDLPGTRFVADRLTGVSLVGLDDGDEAWAAAVEQSILTSDRERDAIRSSVLGSEFDVARAATALSALWSGASPDARSARSDGQP